MASVRITLVNYWPLWDVNFQLLSDGWRWLCTHSSLFLFTRDPCEQGHRFENGNVSFEVRSYNPSIRHWKDWCWRWNSSILMIWCEQLTRCKNPQWRKRLRAGEGGIEDEVAGWHHRCNGHELGQTLGDGEGQTGLACCNPWGCKE